MFTHYDGFPSPCSPNGFLTVQRPELPPCPAAGQLCLVADHWCRCRDSRVSSNHEVLPSTLPHVFWSAVCHTLVRSYMRRTSLLSRCCQLVNDSRTTVRRRAEQSLAIGHPSIPSSLPTCPAQVAVACGLTFIFGCICHIRDLVGHQMTWGSKH